MCTVLSAVEYSNSLEGKVNILLKPIKIDNYLSEVLSHNDKKQLKLAETEKYAHVTYFFNVGQEHKTRSRNTLAPHILVAQISNRRPPTTYLKLRR